jgi:hypothetical protein
MSKRILIVTRAFYPEISPRSFRATELAFEFVRSGHRTTVITINRGGVYKDLLQAYPELTIHTLLPLRFKEINDSRNRIISIIKRGFARILMLLFEYPNVELVFRISRALKKVSGFDLLISIACPHPVHWGVAKARSSTHRIADKWVADCGDPYMGDRADSFRKLFYFKYIEKWCFRKADFISIPFEGARDAYYPEFQSKIRIIPQGFRLDDMDLPKYKGRNSYPVFAYTGYFIPGKRDPRNFLEFLATCKNEFRFIVYTRMKDLIEPYQCKLRDKLIIRDFIPRKELLKDLAAMDFLVNFDNNIPTQLPSKLIDYTITGRPVLNIKDSGDFKFFDEFIKGDYANKMILPEPETFNIERIAKQFLTIS